MKEQNIREEFEKEFAVWREEPGTVDFESVNLLVGRLNKIAISHHNTTLKEIEEGIGNNEVELEKDETTEHALGRSKERQRVKQLINQKLIK